MRSAVVLFAVAVALAYAWPQQGPGWEENSHYALVVALADGKPYVDDVIGTIGDLGTGDLGRHEGHSYVIKAPGLAGASVPLFLVLDALGVRTTGDPTQMLWALGLLVVVLPAVILLLLVRSFAERVALGTGTAAAAALGLGTLLFPFGTLFFSHALAACLVFAAFAALWWEREGLPRVGVVALAGLLAGLAVVVEYPSAVAGAILAVYAAARSGPARRFAAYAAGVIIGVLPALAFHQWAFGSPFRVAYEFDRHQEEFGSGFFGIGTPSARVLLELTFSQHGLLVLSPVLACAVAGTVLLYRRGRRAESLVIAAVAVAYLAYISAFFVPWGGLWAGPRYAIVVLPFLAVPLGLAFRAWPLATASLAAVSIAIMTALTGTQAHAGYHNRWFERVAEREFPSTALATIGITGWYAIVPFFLAAAVAVVAAAVSLGPLRVEQRDLVLAVAAVGAWVAVALAAPKRSELGGAGLDYASYWIVFALAAITIAALVARRARTSAASPLSPRAMRSAR
jgi:hypothetical protein